MKKKIWIAIVVILVINAGVAALFLYMWNKTYSSLTVEAGTEIVAEDFIRGSVQSICFAEDSPSFDTSVPGKYILKITADGFTRNCTLYVEDTIAPVAIPQSVSISTGEVRAALNFVTDIQDETEVKVSFETEPDFTVYGQQEVVILLEDAGGNQTRLTTELNILKVDVNGTYVWDVANGTPKAEWFLLADGEIYYAGGALHYVDFKKVGTYPVWLNADGTLCKVFLEITDSTAPEFTVKEVQGYVGHSVDASLFVDTVEDETEVTWSFENEPKWEREGAQSVTVVVTDSAGNRSKEIATMTLIPDTEPPVILGAGNISICLGENVSYRAGVSAYDACDGDVAIEIDNSDVNLAELGTYHVIYTARDSAGNVATSDIKLTVMPERKEEVSMESMYALVDRVLAQIITDGMTDYQKAEAIYYWTRGNISFISDSQKENWVESAYDGILYRKGDCYTYACVSKAMLTRVGIPNIDIWRNSTMSSHYWNLVDTGEGWYHFDATPRADKTIVFMWSENQLIADEAVRRSHVYDHSLFPTVNAD